MDDDAECVVRLECSTITTSPAYSRHRLMKAPGLHSTTTLFFFFIQGEIFQASAVNRRVTAHIV